MLRASGKTFVALTILTGAAFLAACGKGPHLLYGLLEADGQWAITPRYTDAAPPQEGLLPVEIDGKWGFVDTTGKVVIEARFDKVLPLSEGLAAVLQGAAWSFIDAAGAVAIAGPFDAAEPFRGGLAAVRVDDRWGFVNHAGARVIAPLFEELGGLVTEIGPDQHMGCFSEGLCAARQGDKWGFIDRSGAWAVPPKFQDVLWFQEGLAGARGSGAEGESTAPFGYIDRHGEWVIEPRFVAGLWFSGGRAVAMVELRGAADATDAAVSDDAKYGVDYRSILIDRHGREIADVGWNAEIFGGAAAVLVAVAPDYLAEGMVPATDGELWGFMDRDGRWVIPPRYVFAFPFKGGLAPAALGDPSQGWTGAERWGLIDRSGRWVVEPTLAALGPWGGASIPAQRGARWGLLDRDGRWVMEPRYPEVEDWLQFPGTSIAAGAGFFRFGVYANHRWAAVDRRGRRSKPVEYEWLEELVGWAPDSGGKRAQRLAYARDGLWGLADGRLKPVTPAQFDSAPVSVGEDELLKARKAGLSGCIDALGRWVVPPEFSETEACASGELRARKDGQWGLWRAGSGWRPDAAPDEVEVPQDPGSVLVSVHSVWRQEGGRYRLYVDGTLAPGVAAVDEVRSGYARSPVEDRGAWYAFVRRGDRWGVLDERGRERLPVDYEEVGNAYDDLFAVKRNALWSIVDRRGRTLIGPRTEELHPFNRRVAVFCTGDLCGLADREGRVLLAPTFSFVRPLTASLAEAGVSYPDGSVRSAGVVEATGRILVGQEYYSIRMFSPTRLLAWDARGHYHLLDVATGRPAEGAPELAGAPGKVIEGLAAADVRTPEGEVKAGYLDGTGRLAIEAHYDADSAENFARGVAVVARGGRCGVIDKRGRAVLPLEYQHCQRLADGRVLFAEEAPLRIAAPAGGLGGATPPATGSPAP